MNTLFSSVMNFFRAVGGFFLTNSEMEPPEQSPDYYCEDTTCVPYTCCICPYRVWLSHIEGGGIGYNKGYSTLGFFGAIPFCTTGFMPLIDLRGHLFDDGRLAANVGTGFRYISYETKTIYGINVYYDWRRGSYGHFQQVGVGFEAMGTWWAFRTNAYLPFGDKTEGGHRHQFDYPGGFRMTCQKQETALRGIDAELGYYYKSPCRPFTFYTGVGPYYFNKHCGDDIVGAMGRVILTGWDILGVEGRGYYDSSKNWFAQGRLTLTIPLGCRQRTAWVRTSESCCPLTCEEVCLLREIAELPVLRNEIIVTDKNCRWTTNF